MLKLQEGESIHSVIFRTHVVNGVSNFKNILTSKGLWQRSPSILKSTLHFYEPIHDDIFFKLLDGIHYFKRSGHIFLLPQNGYKELSHFFLGEKASSTYRDDFRITFCEACFVEQLANIGFIYFKNHWLYNSYCNEHEIKLTELKESTYGKCVKSLSSIHKVRSINTIKPKKNKSEEVGTVQPLSLAPCMGEELYKYSLLRVTEFPKSAFATQSVSVDALRQPIVLERIYQTLQAENHKCYFELMKFGEYKTVDGGYINKSSLPITFYKSKKNNCHNCQYSSCMANKTIVYAKEDFKLANECELNLRILHDYSYWKKKYTFSEKRDFINSLSTENKLYEIEVNKPRYAYLEPFL